MNAGTTAPTGVTVPLMTGGPSGALNTGALDEAAPSLPPSEFPDGLLTETFNDWNSNGFGTPAPPVELTKSLA